MKYTINTRKTKKGLAFDLDFRWRGHRERPLLGYNLSKEQADEAAIAMIAKIKPALPDPKREAAKRHCVM